MQKKYSVLIIDDHPLISGAYKNAFEHISDENEEITFDIAMANDCDSAIEQIERACKKDGLDIVFLDISLPPSKDKEILSGEDIGVRLNKLLPEAKIIVATTFNENYRIYSIFKSVNPEAFLIKNDITPDELVTAIKTVMDDPPYYSKSVLKMLRKQVGSKYDLDKIDRQLLFELSKGTKTKKCQMYCPCL